MPMVILHYGPYEAHGALKHRIQRLHGLLTGLAAKQYEVEVAPSQHINRLEVEMEGSIIFQSDIRNLLFNVECEDDVVCQRIIAIIDEAVSRIYSNYNVPKFVSITEGRRYLEKCKTLTTRDYFSSGISLLYEHQTHCREISKPADFLHKHDERYASLENVHSDFGEEEDVCAYDEYADWDFATSIIRAIVELLPEDRGDEKDDMTVSGSISLNSPLRILYNQNI
ncbi:hypothetical protein Trydic_g17234 [Trypoxylus dichotomus]